MKAEEEAVRKARGAAREERARDTKLALLKKKMMNRTKDCTQNYRSYILIRRVRNNRLGKRERGDEVSRKAFLLFKERGRDVLGEKKQQQIGENKTRTLSAAVSPAGP